MRAPDELSAGVPRTAVISGSTPPPRTIMPAGSPVWGSHDEKRVSSGSNMSAPIGENPHSKSAATQQASNRPPTRRRREKIRPKPNTPKAMMRFEGIRKKPRVFDRTKNMTSPAYPVMRIGRKIPNKQALKWADYSQKEQLWAK